MRRTEMKRTRMKRRAPAKVELSAAEELARDAWHAATARDRTCAHCGQRGQLFGHHVVLARHVRAAGGDVWDLRNRLGVLHACHMAHHSGGLDQRFDQTMLRQENIDFAYELLGDRAQEYLDKHYPRTPVSRADKWKRTVAG